MANPPEGDSVGVYLSVEDHHFGRIASGSTLSTQEDWVALGFEGAPMAEVVTPEEGEGEQV